VIWYDIFYDIYLLQLGFRSVAVVGILVKKKNRKETAIYKRRNNKKIQKTRNRQNRKHIDNKKATIPRILKKNIQGVS